MLESEVDRYKVIDTDTHVIEPYDLWTSRLDVKQVGRQGPAREVGREAPGGRLVLRRQARRRRRRRRPGRLARVPAAAPAAPRATSTRRRGRRRPGST